MQWTYRLSLAALMLASSCSTFAACQVVTPPQGWATASLRWDGGCAGEHANGLGVLKEQQGTTVNRLFFGEVANGELVQGVVDVPQQGFIAGRFANGQVEPSDDRQVLLTAFEVAAHAAAAAAERFEQAGNAASAAYYRGKEKALREQLD